MYGLSRSGMRIFAVQGRDQYLFEGIFIAGFTIGSALALMIAYFSTKVRFPLLRHAGVLVALSIWIILVIQIWDAYTDKTRWYQLQEVVPSIAWSFITATVKKSSYLPKRLIRLSEIWLFEFKDWKSFNTKFNQLIVDYVTRTLGISNAVK